MRWKILAPWRRYTAQAKARQRDLRITTVNLNQDHRVITDGKRVRLHSRLAVAVDHRIPHKRRQRVLADIKLVHTGSWDVEKDSIRLLGAIRIRDRLLKRARPEI